MFDPVTLSTIASTAGSLFGGEGGGLGGMFGGGGETSSAASDGTFTTGDLITGGSKSAIPTPLIIAAGFLILIFILRSK